MLPAGAPNWAARPVETRRLQSMDTKKRREDEHKAERPKSAGESHQERSEEWKSSNKKRDVVTVNDHELAQGIDVLKSNVRLHRAAMGDRYRFSADSGRCVGMSISGAAAAEQVNDWVSDASQLNTFHNIAMRMTNRSDLKPLPKVEGSRGKKAKAKKPKPVDPLDLVQLDDRGLFAARYPTDSSLKTLRRLRRDLFPEVERPPTPPPVKEPDAIANLRGDSGFGGHFRRSTAGENPWEADVMAAMIASDYE